jgi:hypothetical protein
MFSAQSEKGAAAASKIQLISDEAEAGPRLPAEAPSKPQKEIILPPGVKDPRKEPEPKEVRSLHFEADTADLPDVSERKVTPAVPPEEMNPPGSYERLLSTLGRMGGS